MLPLSGADPRLLPFLSAPDEAQARKQLTQLLDQHAQPTIRGTLRRLYGSRLSDREDNQDIGQEVILQLMMRLLHYRAEVTSGSQPRPITYFPAYVAVTTRHQCINVLRKRRTQSGAAADVPQTRVDTPLAEEEMGAANVFDVSPAERIDQRSYMQRLWQEIRALPLPQRTALLLNLRDDRGRGVLELMPYADMASLDEIAEMLELSPEQFARLREQFPLTDATIAEHLGVTQRDVINLRLSARRRLTRRLTNRDSWAEA